GPRSPADSTAESKYAILPPWSACSGVMVAKPRMSSATVPVQPVWWLAPRPAPLSPWKYSWKRIRSRQCGSLWNVSIPPYTGRRSLLVARERRDQPLGDPHRDVAQVQLASGTGRERHREPVAVVGV